MDTSTKKKIIRVIMSLVITGLICGFLAAAGLFAGYLGMVHNKKAAVSAQETRLLELKNYYSSDSFVPFNEASICAFSLEDSVKNGVKYNELQILGTHNSYKAKPQWNMYFLHPVSYKNMTYYFDNITAQLNSGLRCFEFDLRDSKKDGIVCYHTDYGDNTSNCYDLAMAMEELALWSANNPEHLPVCIYFEQRGYNFDMLNKADFTKESHLKCEKIVKEKLGDMIYTPSMMLGGKYDTLAQMAEDNGWPELGDMLGKIVILNSGTSYFDNDPALKTQVMFPFFSIGTYKECPQYKAFVLHNEITTVGIQNLSEAYENGDSPEIVLNDDFKKLSGSNCVIRSRVDAYPYYYPPLVQIGINAGVNLISSDYIDLETRHSGYTIETSGKTAWLKNNK